MRHFAHLALSSLVMATILVIVMPQAQSQQPPKEQEQNTQQPNGLQTNANPQVDQSEQQQSHSRSKNKENNQSPKEGLWKWFLNASAVNDKAIVAISTIVIAAFTALLFLATILLWFGGERHSERKLRAYVSVRPGHVFNFVPQKPSQFVAVRCTYFNHGQTPAFRVSTVYDVGVFPKRNQNSTS